MKLLNINYNVMIENMQMHTLQMTQGVKKSGNVQIKSELKNKFYLTHESKIYPFLSLKLSLLKKAIEVFLRPQF